jgi:DNA-directed RNA polymerase specialized sigma24 family protein
LTILESPNEFAKLIACRCSPLSCVKHSAVELSDKELEALDSEPTPDLALRLTEECQHLLECLEDDTLRRVALWKMEGYTNREIADRLGCVEKTVERKIKSIRQLWFDAGETGS